MNETVLLGTVIGLFAGLCIGAGIAFLIVRSSERAKRSYELGEEGKLTATANTALEALRGHYKQLQSEHSVTRDTLRKNELKLGEEGKRSANAIGALETIKSQYKKLEAECITLRETKRKYESAWTTASTKLKEAEKNIQQQRALLDEAQTKLSENFQTIAATALRQNNQGFLTLANERFDSLAKQSAADLIQRQGSIETLVKPVSDSLLAYRSETQQLEERRLREIGSVGEQLRAVAESQIVLQKETSKLVGALKSPSVRGRWGEITLKRTAELAGMSANCDFHEQVSVTEDGTCYRPDMIIRMPSGREVVVDSKVPLAAYLEALEATSEDTHTAALKRHCDHIITHVNSLSGKEYWSQFSNAPEFVVLFIPNDSFLSAAVEMNLELIETALSKKIVIATPSTFFALLRAIEYGWRQRNADENAQKISELGAELWDRFAILIDHLKKSGASLGKAVESYNSTVNSFESRIMPSVKKLKAYGSVGKKEIDEPSILPLEAVVRMPSVE